MDERNFDQKIYIGRDYEPPYNLQNKIITLFNETNFNLLMLYYLKFSVKQIGPY